MPACCIHPLYLAWLLPTVPESVKMYKAVVGQQGQVSVDVVDISVEPVGKATDALRWVLHYRFERFHVTSHQMVTKSSSIVEGDDMGASSPCSHRSIRSNVASCAVSSGHDVI